MGLWKSKFSGRLSRCVWDRCSCIRDVGWVWGQTGPLAVFASEKPVNVPSVPGFPDHPHRAHPFAKGAKGWGTRRADASVRRTSACCFRCGWFLLMRCGIGSWLTRMRGGIWRRRFGSFIFRILVSGRVMICMCGSWRSCCGICGLRGRVRSDWSRQIAGILRLRLLFALGAKSDPCSG